MGLPVVSSVATWRGTVIPQGEGIVATDDAEAFAEQTARLLNNPEYRDEMSHRARTAVEAHYRWEVQLQALDQVIADHTRVTSHAGSTI